MNKKATGVFFTVLAACLMLITNVSAKENAHKDHSSCIAIRSEEDLLAIKAGESYYLDSDVTLSKTLTVSGEIKICLNGNVIRYTAEDGSVFHIGKEGALRLFDCSDTPRFYDEKENGLWFLTDSECEKTLKGGAIIGGQGEKNEIDELKSEHICGGFAYIDGGALFLYGGNIVGNQADYGGAIYITGDGCLEINGGRLYGNLASARGGGIFVRSGEILLQSGSVSENRSEKNGGGIDISGESIMEMRGGFVTGNTAEAWSGGIENFGRFDMYGGTISANHAGEDAGGVYNGGSFTMHGGSIRENSAKYGGGVCNDSKMTLHDGTVLSNLAKESGGGIYNADTLVINGGTIASNTAVTSGGGIENDGTCTMYAGMIGGTDADDANMAHLGGGICVYSGSFTMYGGAVSNNTGVDGGGIENEALFSMQGGTVTYNYAALQGGGITNRGRLILGADAKVVSNASGANENEHAGGGIYWITEENSFVSVSGKVNITDNTTNGTDANLVIFGKGEVSVSQADESMRIGLTLLDKNKKTANGLAARFEDTESSEKALAVFFSDIKDFDVSFKDSTLRIAKRSTWITICIVSFAIIAVCVVCAVFAFVKIRRNSRDFKKRV